MKKQLHKTLHSLANKFIKYAKELKDGYDTDTIHELRTCYKKIRAFLRWQKAGKEIFADIKELYNTAGDLRNIQVVQQMLKGRTDTVQSFQNWLSLRMGKIKKQWDKTGHKKICDHFIGRIDAIEINKRKNKIFFSKRTGKIKQILSIDPVPDNSLHEIRKMVKDMQYVLEWWRNKIGKTQQLTNKLSVNKLESVSRQIGEYNDIRMLLILLTTYAQQEKDPSLIEVINPFINKWQHIKSVEKEKLIAILHYEQIEK